MLSGSSNYCGLRSLVICRYGRRRSSAEPELFMQPPWSSQASRLGRAANGAAGAWEGGVGNDPGCSHLWVSLGCGGCPPKWTERGWGVCRRQEPGEHLLCVGARSSVHPMRGQMWVSFLQEAAPALRLATWALSLLSQQAAHERRMQDAPWAFREYRSMCTLPTWFLPFFPSLGWGGQGKYSLIYSASSGSRFC